ncbi:MULTISPECIES: AI-2E family transporter [Pacificibacter]|uniref:AI-2E family transporter n=1 Tax=Pacificibacter TaxID=1042323 RepID=UPI001C080C58|nr:MULTISPECIES: AI-2E family transporter [Pacificibacter]MBU2937453.1 AI-2E family transporter [Pacificibacter marinus]MDO6615633.1 AI-2E family transporter [Pacificibacter sp. 1_MG-2023]
MALPVRDQVKYWSIASVVFLGAIWLLSDVMLPFILAMAVAYMLDPVADRLEAMGLSRAVATVVITAVAAFAFVLIALLVLPTLVGQATDLIATAPQLFDDLQKFLTAKFPEILDEQSQLHQSLLQIGETIQSKGGELLSTAVGSVMSIFNVMMILFLVPVITFYLLLDWDRMVEEIDNLLPRDHAPVVRRLAFQIDKTLASFIRGQGTVCLILGGFYAAALMLVGLKFGLVTGAIAGALTFIPYVGALVGGVLSIGLALFQFWGGTEVVDGVTVTAATDWLRIGLVIGIFALGQFFEGNILTPNLVGSSIGLHPVWLIFALTAFGAIFGFVGMLIAVPVAASIGVVARFAVEQYHESRLYTGLEATSQRTATDAGPATTATDDPEHS